MWKNSERSVFLSNNHTQKILKLQIFLVRRGILNSIFVNFRSDCILLDKIRMKKSFKMTKIGSCQKGLLSLIIHIVQWWTSLLENDPNELKNLYTTVFEYEEHDAVGISTIRAFLKKVRKSIFSIKLKFLTFDKKLGSS